MYKVAVSLISMSLPNLTRGINKLIQKCHKNGINCDIVGFNERGVGDNNNMSFHSVMLELTSSESIECIKYFHYNLDEDTLDF